MAHTNPNTWTDGTPRSACNAFAAAAQYHQHKADIKADRIKAAAAGVTRTALSPRNSGLVLVKPTRHTGAYSKA